MARSITVQLLEIESGVDADIIISNAEDIVHV